MSYFTSLEVFEPSENNKKCWIIKVSSHSAKPIHFCCDKIRVLFIFQIIDYASDIDYDVLFVLKNGS